LIYAIIDFQGMSNKMEILAVGEEIRSLIRGIGSVLDIAPHHDYSEFVPKEDAMQRLQHSFERVGKDIDAAMKQVDFQQHTPR